VTDVNVMKVAAIRDQIPKRMRFCNEMGSARETRGLRERSPTRNPHDNIPGIGR